MSIDDEAWNRAEKYVPEFIFVPGIDLSLARSATRNAIARAIMDEKYWKPNGDPIPLGKQDDTIALLTTLIHELRRENEILKNEIERQKSKEIRNSLQSSLSKQIGDIESGKVVER